MVALMEGAMISGIFHGDLHGGNLLVLAGRAHRPARLRHRRPSVERARVAFLRLMVAAMTNDLIGQMAACATSARSPRTPTCGP